MSGPALLWEAGHYKMRMHYIGRRELRDFYVTAVIAAGGEVVLRERRVGGRRVLDGFLPAVRVLVAAPSAPSGARGLPRELRESAFQISRPKSMLRLKRAGNSRTPRAGRFATLLQNPRPKLKAHAATQLAGETQIRRLLQPQNRRSVARVL